MSSYLLAPGHFQTELARAGADLVTRSLLQPSPDQALVELIVRRFEQAARRVSWWRVAAG
ncbi:MAG TPA: hypothetical protein VNZ66_11410 [Aeromicrobium sp.]|nr:hypothetical protein [Aeromicrobium sp.]